jgi:hypothetical protein
MVALGQQTSNCSELDSSNQCVLQSPCKNSSAKFITFCCVGPLREFLERVDLEGNWVYRWFFSKWLKQMPGREKALRRNEAASSGEAAGDATDTRTIGVEGTETIKKGAQASGFEKFFSGDNPIVVVMSILSIFVAAQVALHPR